MGKSRTSFGKLMFPDWDTAKAAMHAGELRLGQWFRVDGEDKACRYMGAATLRAGNEAAGRDGLKRLHAMGHGRKTEWDKLPDDVKEARSTWTKQLVTCHDSPPKSVTPEVDVVEVGPGPALVTPEQLEDYAVTAATLIPSIRHDPRPVLWTPRETPDELMRSVYVAKAERALDVSGRVGLANANGCKAAIVGQRMDGNVPIYVVACAACGRSWKDGVSFSENVCPQRNPPPPPKRGFGQRLASAFRSIVRAPHRRPL